MILIIKNVLITIVLCCSLFIFISCAHHRYSTQSELVKTTGPIFLDNCEVSVGDWLVYIASTSFTEDQKVIHLGDHPDAIDSKLPAMEFGGWSNYTMNAFLRKSKKMVTVTFKNVCQDRSIELTIAKTAWDSISKFHFMDLPIVGITYEQAMQYVEYRQDLLNSCDVDPKDTFQYACFLPSPDQFDFVQGMKDSVNHLGCSLFNFQGSFCPDCPHMKKSIHHPVWGKVGTSPTYVWSYFPYQFGLYNIKGNVAEMTSVKGIAKGGSYMEYASEAINREKQFYEEPAAWLGFRVWYRRIPGRG